MAEAKAKVVAAVWGTELIHFFAALANLHQDDFKNIPIPENFIRNNDNCFTLTYTDI